MDLDGAIAGAPGVIRLGGKTYLASQPTQKDLESIRKAIGIYVAKRRKSKLSRLVEDPAWKHLTAEQQTALLLKSADSSAEPEDLKKIDPSELIQILGTPDAVRVAAWILLKRENPNIDKERDIDPFITETNCDMLFLEFMEACGMADLGN